MKAVIEIIRAGSVRTIDVLIGSILLFIPVIILSGGLFMEFGGIRIRAFNTENPFFFIVLLIAARKIIDFKTEIREIPAVKILYSFILKCRALLNNREVKTYIVLIILALAFVIRFHNIESPLIGHHAWRNTDTAAVALNFHENGYNFLYPQINWGGDSTGYVETEFPLYTFTIAVLYKLFGVSPAYGRFLSLICSLVGAFFLYLLVKKHLDRDTALWACLFFTILPVNIYFNRAFQPESAMIMFSILGIYYFSQWTEHEKAGHCFLSAVYISLSCLLKIPTLYIGLPILYLAWIKFDKKIFGQWLLWLYVTFVFCSVGLWYSHSYQISLESGHSLGIWNYGSDKWGNWDLIVKWKFWRKLFWERPLLHLTMVGYPLFIVGLFIKRQTRKERLFDFWLLALLIYIIIVAQGNYAHDYYQLPFIVPAAVFIGKVFGKWFGSPEDNRTFILSLCMVSIMVLSAGTYNSVFMKKEKIMNLYMIEIADFIKQHTDKEDLLLVVGNGDPTLINLSNRRGWSYAPVKLERALIQDKIRRGVKYIVWPHPRSSDNESLIAELGALLPSGSRVAVDKEKYFIYKIADVEE